METMMVGRLRKRSGMEQDLQNWLGSGIQIKVGVCLQGVLKMAAKMFSALADDILQAPDQHDGSKELYCDCCCTRFVHYPKYANGDPRNIA